MKEKSKLFLGTVMLLEQIDELKATIELNEKIIEQKDKLLNIKNERLDTQKEVIQMLKKQVEWYQSK